MNEMKDFFLLKVCAKNVGVHYTQQNMVNYFINSLYDLILSKHIWI